MRCSRWIRVVGAVALCGAARHGALGQRSGMRDSTLATCITAGEADGEPRRRQLLNALNLNLGFTTLRLGGGFLIDFIAYDQDSARRKQVHLASQGELGDIRLLP